MADLDGKHVLIMATDRFEESELFGPRALVTPTPTSKVDE